MWVKSPFQGSHSLANVYFVNNTLQSVAKLCMGLNSALSFFYMRPSLTKSLNMHRLTDWLLAAQADVIIIGI